MKKPPAMAKHRDGKLTKIIKSMLKKIQSFNLLGLSSRSSDSAAVVEDLQPVYVGKSRRRYLVNSRIAENPVFRELVERRRRCCGGESIAVDCEVVLFEHLLWMLENADPQPECLDELIDYYSL